jgi:Family of unknown function (DUF6328)
MEQHHETLEEEATHVTDEARMLLPGIQALLGFQLIAVFNQRFVSFSAFQQLLHLASLLCIALAMTLIMATAAYHRQAERGRVSRRFVNLASRLLTIALLPFAVGVCIDVYLVSVLILQNIQASVTIGAAAFVVIVGLWFGLPRIARWLADR